MSIDDYSVKKLRGKEIPLVKVAWNHGRVMEHTWEKESDMREHHPLLFRSCESTLFIMESIHNCPESKGSNMSQYELILVRLESTLIDFKSFMRVRVESDILGIDSYTSRGYKPSVWLHGIDSSHPEIDSGL
ncbi:hypothetical protein PIB30_104287 [Stylosanthes scabra]|uniref:Chromo domain-containing protein n=1 Tax=Stylosanthes scabra TaxID=79078 RepID=A0ABU6XZ10_9FABA|nr:hypothetical protein [Stylosanthes scabra]